MMSLMSSQQQMTQVAGLQRQLLIMQQQVQALQQQVCCLSQLLGVLSCSAEKPAAGQAARD
jgi:hypothetical protein